MSRKNLPGILLIGLICLSFTHPTYKHVKFVYDWDTVLLETGDKAGDLGIIVSLNLSRSVEGAFIREYEQEFGGLFWNSGFLGDGPVIGTDNIPTGQNAQQLAGLSVRNDRQE